ncbi:MAG TPA: glycosyltransferase family 39 protein [Candidatus Sulfotelmatobacter sp.]|jgi:4-amino-4-deoxy-L-arabinose transferase-like glycosyltransferase|nr:glycosyltransferase family 39 protein [Candidatus Sulfotelmatobacter sp.]
MSKKTALILLTLILFLAAFMRLYMISDYMTFLGDEGRDVLVARDILQGHFTLLGPRASAGNFFTGPIYYYMMAPFLWLFQYDPVGPAVMVALMGVATVWLIYLVGSNFFDRKTGLIAAALYAVSPVVITYSHSSWNPNVVPFFALLTLYLLYKAVTSVRSWKYYLLVGLLLGICIQLHYIALFLAVIVAISLFLMQWFLNNKIQILPLLMYYLEIFVGFIIGYSPFLAFEVRHGFPNTQTIISFITTDTTSGQYATYHAFYQPIVDVFFRLYGHLIFHYPSFDLTHGYSLLQLQLFGLLIIIFAIASMVTLFRNKNKFVVILLSVWLVLGVLLFGLYKKPIYDYYLVFMFPLPFLLIANLIGQAIELKKGALQYGIALGAFLFIGIFGYNLYFQPFQYEPNRQKAQTEEISKFVISQTDKQPFNFALLSAGNGNSDYAYIYYLTILNHAPVTIENSMVDPQRKTVTDQLMIVCEDIKCKPLGNSLWEVAGFGQATVWKNWDVSVVKVYKMVHVVIHTTTR